MIQTTKTALLLAATFTLATSALAQAPTEAQRAAIKSNCRSDYMAHCSSIPPGGAASLQCLQQNMASLSGACASAVKAVSAPAESKAEPAAAPAAKEEPRESKAEPAPPTEPAKSAPAKPESAKSQSGKSEPAAKTSTKATGKTAKPSSAQIAAIRSNCRSDYPKVCAGVPTGGAAALECLEKNKAKLSAACEKAVAAAGGGSAASATANASPDAAAPAAAAPAPLVLRPMLPRERLFVARSACGADIRSLCAGVPVGGGEIMQCLASQPAALSPGCRDVLGQFAAQ